MQSPEDLKPAPTPGSGKQPNFLQKLYHFLALAPHPCPEVIYWSADSRLLVIAEPDRLVREVLPFLFKHDKMSSFGRQLNIYGFSRLYPGRQFKDAHGNVSDASVWSHPTLHRASTAEEIASIKRRAAPKLIRTRRLANGEIIRSRAGQAVHDKFEQMQNSLSKSVRRRSSSIAPPKLTLESPLSAKSYAYTSGGYSFDPSPVDRSGEYALPESNLDSHEDRAAVTFFRPPPLAVDTRLIQSCPASVHSSPVFAAAQPLFSPWQSSPQSWESTSASSPLDWDQNWLPTPMDSPHAANHGIHAILEPSQHIPTVDPSWVTLPPWAVAQDSNDNVADVPAEAHAQCMCGTCDQCRRARPLSSIWEHENDEESARKEATALQDLAAVHEHLVVHRHE